MTTPTHGPIDEQNLRQTLEHLLRDEGEVEAAVLFGSRAIGNATADSDWDIALIMAGPRQIHWPMMVAFYQQKTKADVVCVEANKVTKGANRAGCIEANIAQHGRLLAGRWTRPPKTTRRPSVSWTAIGAELHDLHSGREYIAYQSSHQWREATKNSIRRLTIMTATTMALHPKSFNNPTALIAQLHEHLSTMEPVRQEPIKNLIEALARANTEPAHSRGAAISTLTEIDTKLWEVLRTTGTRARHALIEYLDQVERTEQFCDGHRTTLSENQAANTLRAHAQAAARSLKSLIDEPNPMPRPRWGSLREPQYALEQPEDAPPTRAEQLIAMETHARAIVRASTRELPSSEADNVDEAIEMITQFGARFDLRTLKRIHPDWWVKFSYLHELLEAEGLAPTRQSRMRKRIERIIGTCAIHGPSWTTWVHAHLRRFEALAPETLDDQPAGMTLMELIPIEDTNQSPPGSTTTTPTRCSHWSRTPTPSTSSAQSEPCAPSRANAGNESLWL